MSSPKKETEKSFESALERLENLVEEMEEGSLNLDKMISNFEEGTQLVKFCSNKLNEVERKIEILIKKGQETEEFEVSELSNKVN